MTDFDKKDSIPLGLYVHIPFCATKCSFCYFYHEEPFRQSIDKYLKIAKNELENYAKQRIEIDTIFFGGGTPSVLTAKDLKNLAEPIAKLRKNNQVEWTVELAPSSVKIDKLEMLKSLGVNRVSLGIQTFQEHLIEKFRRQQKFIFKAYEYIQKVGFDHVNIDLMFGFPDQKLSEWESDLTSVCSLNPDHISAYMLTLEDPKKLSLVENWRSEESEIEFYQLSCEFLASFGYKQYEISNFAKPNSECLHNLNTWNMFDWIGIGPSAASQFKNKRYENHSCIELWQKTVENQESYHFMEELTQEKLAIDCIIFGLRMNDGISLRDLEKRFSDLNFSVLNDYWEILESDGLIEKTNYSIKCTKNGHILIDGMGSNLLNFENKLKKM